MTATKNKPETKPARDWAVVLDGPEHYKEIVKDERRQAKRPPASATKATPRTPHQAKPALSPTERFEKDKRALQAALGHDPEGKSAEAKPATVTRESQQAETRADLLAAFRKAGLDASGQWWLAEKDEKRIFWPDLSEALAILESEAVQVRATDPRIAQLASLYLHAKPEKEKRDRETADERRDFEAIRKAIAAAHVTTDNGKRMIDALLRDFSGDNATVREAKLGHTVAPLLPAAKPAFGRRVDEGVRRALQDFEAVHGWNLDTVAAALIISGAARVRLSSLRRSLSEWARFHNPASE